MGPDDFTDFLSFLGNTDVHIESCEYCAQQNIHCQVAQGGTSLDACTSCIAAERVCVFTAGPSALETQLEPFAIPHAAVDEYMSPLQQSGIRSRSRSDSNLESHEPLEEHTIEPAINNPKIGARFSREALRILRNWLLSNHRHPYLTNEEKDNLARQTGLNKTQISNWIANARRRGKVRTPSSTSSSPHQHTNGLNIPRRATPVMREMSPMERWKHSPPDQEPASITDIATAALSSEFSARLDTSLANYGEADDALVGSIGHPSSASSSKTSNSSDGSFGSAYSHGSRGSLKSLSSLTSRGRRRRRRQVPKAVNISAILPLTHTYQCTFCTETFKTKHDWQRHEKSLHLSLERWICTPDGPIQFCAERNCSTCVYCGLKNPSSEHTEQHNDFVCAERSLEEKTFYRKDHLRQHLNIVHEAKFQKWPMAGWKASTPKIRSRCGFCGFLMDSWDLRVEHLAQHFKNGKSMADWKGDWGFPEEVLKVVENGMPPYLIHYDQNTLNPYEASNDGVRNRRTLEDYVKLYLVDYINNQALAGAAPTDDQLLIEAQRIVRKVDIEDTSQTGPDISWFRDLIMLCGPSYGATQLVNQRSQETSGNLTWTTQIEKMKASKSANSSLSMIGCEKEKILMKYVKCKQASGQPPTDSELQMQACKAIEDVEPKANFKCKEAVQWFKFLINSSTNWLSEFKRRTGLSPISGKMREHVQLANSGAMNYSIYNFHGSHQDQQASEKIFGENMPRHSHIGIYDGHYDNQAVLTELNYLSASEDRNGLTTPQDGAPTAAHEARELISAQLSDAGTSATISPQALHWSISDEVVGCTGPMSTNDYLPASIVGKPLTNRENQPLRYFLSDVNCYGRLEKELTRFVASCLSPNNPLQHIPSDEEIQHQARWIIYDDDDPWNQTAADNVEWLARFKRDAGIISTDKEFGLRQIDIPRPWRVKDGGTGLQPPFLMPKPGKHIKFDEDTRVYVDDRPYNVSKDTAERYVRALISGQYQFPPSVFCSRELEDGLNAYIEECIMALQIPTDDDLRVKAREILGVERTAADDPKLLETFKATHLFWRSQVNEENYIMPGSHSDSSTPEFIGEANTLVLDTQQISTNDLITEFSSRIGV